MRILREAEIQLVLSQLGDATEETVKRICESHEELRAVAQTYQSTLENILLGFEKDPGAHSWPADTASEALTACAGLLGGE